MRLEQLPVPPALRTRLMRRHRAALLRNTRTVLRNEVLDGPRARANLNVHFTPVARDGAPESVLMMFEITGRSLAEAAARKDVRRRRSPSARGKAGSNSGRKK